MKEKRKHTLTNRLVLSSPPPPLPHCTPAPSAGRWQLCLTFSPVPLREPDRAPILSSYVLFSFSVIMYKIVYLMWFCLLASHPSSVCVGELSLLVQSPVLGSLPGPMKVIRKKLLNDWTLPHLILSEIKHGVYISYSEGTPDKYEIFPSGLCGSVNVDLWV